MPFLRFKRWTYLTPLAPHVAVCASGHRYLWKGDQQGATAVSHKADVEELLNPPGGQPSDFEIAWDRYGVTFDVQGKEIEVIAPPTPQPDEAKKETPKSRTARPVGRQRK